MSTWISHAVAWAHSRAGNVTIIFALSLAPLAFVTGASIDLSRAVTQRGAALQALDAAGLAAARSYATDEADLRAIVEDFLEANLPDGAYGRFNNLSVQLVDGSRLVLDGDVDIETAFLAGLGVEKINMPVHSEILRGVKKVEMALVLDNTGSMSGSKIQALRDAATALVNGMYADAYAAENVQIAIVPYNGMVNIKGTGFKDEWMDTDGLATHNGENFEPKTNHFDLFTAMDVDWKGCVEMRAAPYDITDDAPGAVADTKFVPFLWPDEPDSSWSVSYDNDYFYDDEDYCDACEDEDGYMLTGDALRAAQQANTAKYSEPLDRHDTTPSTTYGPNKGCGDPITPLTNNQATLLGEITDMTTWSGTGTNGFAGLMWGWRVVSPGEPFDQGVEYEEALVQKAIVMMTDGVNNINEMSNHNGSVYAGYGYLEKERLGSDSYWESEAQIDTNMSTACESIKGEGVIIFTVTFQLNDQDTKDIYRDCASEPEYYFDSDTNAEIVEHFTDIAGEMSQLRVAG